MQITNIQLAAPAVLGFEQAALRCRDTLPRIAGEIYRRRRLGLRVIAGVPCGDDAALLRAACDRIGLSPTIGEGREADLLILPGFDAPQCWAPPSAARPLRVALAGYGVVGQALAARLGAEPGFRIVSILVRDVERHRDVPPPCPPVSDREEFLATRADILIDALSCERTGQELCAALLPKGVHVVSASKRVISEAREPLLRAAVQGGASLLYSAAVGGAAPVLETIAAARARAPIVEVAAVLNGTVNYILHRLHDGLPFDEALRQAQQAGFAEENPAADLSGADAAAKIRLIASEALGIDPAGLAVTTQPLDAATAAAIQVSGVRWVQLARLVRRGTALEASVTLLPTRAVPELPAVADEWNCAAVTTEDGALFRCLGRGAGGAATAEAITADLFHIFDTRPQAEHAGQC